MNETKQSTQNPENAITRTVFWGTIALAAITLLVSGYFFTFLLQEQKPGCLFRNGGFWLRHGNNGCRYHNYHPWTAGHSGEISVLYAFRSWHRAVGLFQGQHFHRRFQQF